MLTQASADPLPAVALMLNFLFSPSVCHASSGPLMFYVMLCIAREIGKGYLKFNQIILAFLAEGGGSINTMRSTAGVLCAARFARPNGGQK